MKRVTILKYAKKLLEEDDSISFSCIAMKQAICKKFNCCYPTYATVQIIFPKFNYDYAIELGLGDIHNNYVWFENNTNRLKFLDHLIELYKDDKTDIRKKYKKYLKFSYETD